MAVTSYAAARHICDRGHWQVTNLALQKILYIAHMAHMGSTNERLIDANFEAWDYGPVEPNLYRKVRIFGDKPIQDIFFSEPDISGSPEGAAIDEACDFLLAKSPGTLVDITHWEKGAWAKNYKPGGRGIVIPDADIVAEYRARLAT